MPSTPPAIITTAVTVATTPTLLCDAKVRRRTLWLRHAGVEPDPAIFIGPSDVTTATGFPVLAGERLPLVGAPGDIGPSHEIYGIVAAATEEMRVFEVVN